ncbi:aminotransferase class I/II-fold pyridoxal phosphate-dependent enzyme [Helicobacter ailurogastricus]|uniref:8-amino-7-oxononanoate synthase n=1 Tax=Helicobacter ailurogastricus TaxID=1578720 RepID=A0A0K2XBQ7_9HELI|nr:pyridoxal phosphate-dependent aminotransferase family protein [Helicobacter ailurogastricus]CRF41034.1 8-amino-7-oxononanoate synthase [Helicobacter ailurogastricus]CRF42322.1 8-amino-7-oxononanoate synthase [Helicobacter ailurogastricus]CRF44780.1 8-amino-7-oxononanoate synthase [Helicobacter ailurogastricus]
MPDYSFALRALRKAHLHRERRLYPPNLADFASNDYLGLGGRKDLLQKAFELLQGFNTHAPKASILVNGYHPLHHELESYLCQLLGFEACVLVGSGFLGNVALIGALVRPSDLLLMDAHYHASGQFIAKKSPNTIFFKHNDSKDLQAKLEKYKPKGRVLIAIEGVYSMDGHIAPLEIFKCAKEHNAYLILDEAHSLGTIGTHLKGVLEHHNLKPTEKTIVLGTFSKAYGSYGAFIGASGEIVDFLCNRAKSIIYTTSLSVLDTALSLVNIEEVYQDPSPFVALLEQMRGCVASFGWHTKSNILTLPFVGIAHLLEIQEKLLKEGFICGAIRPPTVQQPLLRVGLNVQATNTLGLLKSLCGCLQELYLPKRPPVVG